MQERDRRIVYAVRMTVDRCSSAVRLFLNICHAVNDGTSNGLNGYQEPPWSEERDDKDFNGALDGEYDVEWRESAVS